MGLKKNFYNISLAVTFLSFMGACTDDIISRENNNGVNLIAPAFPTIGETESSRTSYTDNGKIQTSWSEGDVIYIGSATGQAANQTMATLVSNGIFEEFICTGVDKSSGKATFSGDNIPEDATMAIYGNRSVLKTNSEGGFTYDLDNYVLTTDYSKTLSETDLLCAEFNKESNSLGTFRRGQALLKFEVANFPQDFQPVSLTVGCGGSTNKYLPKTLQLNADCSFSSLTYRDIFYRKIDTEIFKLQDDGSLVLYTLAAPSDKYTSSPAINITFKDKAGNSLSYKKTISGKTMNANQAINVRYSDETSGGEDDNNFVVKAEHPFLFWNENNNAQIIKELQTDRYATVLNKLRQECDNYINAPLLERVLVGRRLLFVSREAMERIAKLSFLWRYTGDNKYAQRAEAEMLNVCKFTNWNPSHFLDVAEMSAGVAIGYDWLYNYLSQESKGIIEDALYRLSVKLCLSNQSWMTRNNNWNQVCNGGTVLAAIAISNKYPQESKTVIEKALQTILLPMNQYGTNGAFAEGPGYWQYGTSYNVLMLSALESAYNGEVALPMVDNFMKSANYVYNLVGPSGDTFNYGDNKPTYYFGACMFWFASKLNQPNIASREIEMLQTDECFADSTFLPLGLVWAAENQNLNNVSENIDLPYIYYDNGTTPVVAMRNDWNDDNTWFAAMKGGKPNTSHSQMDIGTFVLDAQGERWIMDLGMENYTILEANGLDIWNVGSQESERWTVFRNMNQSHNTLTFNDEQQIYNKSCKIELQGQSADVKSASISLSPVYKQKSVNRKISLYNNKFVVNDAITTGATASTLRWNLVTDAEITIDNVNKTVQLQKNGKTMNIYFTGNNDLEIKTWSTTPARPFENQNEGIYFVGFESSLQANTDYSFEVTFQQ